MASDVREPTAEDLELYAKDCRENKDYDVCPECGKHALRLDKVYGKFGGGVFKCANCGNVEEGDF